MEECIVLYPSPGIGHLISMVELGKRILVDHPISITILLTKPPYNTGSTAPYVKRISQAYPFISFHQLPILSIPLDAFQSPHHETLTFELFRLNNPNLYQTLTSISQTKTIRAFVLDCFCSIALDVTVQLHIPSYFFFTSGAAILADFLYFPTIHNSTTASFKDLNTLIHIPGLPPIPSSDMTLPVLDRNDKVYEGFLNVSISLSKGTGIMVNTFESLEPRALKAISDGLCVPDGPTPPVYCIGPLIASEEDRSGSEGDGRGLECLSWLDSQPRRSVVFLCFGSLGLFTAAQLKEIALGLEKSGQRFLWVVRSPPTEEKDKRFLAPPDPDLDVLLPEGFLNRTKERGLVVKSWAPQVAVLNRESVGGFVTHCGWNSVLEAIWAGVPMVAWPLYAEQRINRVILVEEMKLAMNMEEDPKSGFVSASEVEKRVRGVMESEEGKGLAERTLAASQSAKIAVDVGGSSHTAFAELAHSWKLGGTKSDQ